MTSFRYPIEEIRARCDLVELASTYVTLRRVGKRLVGLCPFHSDKSPSFYVNQETQRYKCFGCGEGGNVVDFLMRIEGLTFLEAVEQLARKAGIEPKRTEAETRSAGERERILRVNNLATIYFRRMLVSSGFAQDYCSARGITDAAVERYKLGFAPQGWSGLIDYLSAQADLKDVVKAGLVARKDSGDGYYDVFRNRLMFPIQDVQDRIIAFGGRALGDEPAKYINSSETPLFSKSRTLYGLNLARKAISKEDKVVLVEGYLDVISAQMAGFENTVAAMGTALTQDHVVLLSRYARNAVLAYDSDSAGMKAAVRSAPMFEEAGVSVRVVEMPSGEDPDSMLRNGDVSVFARIIADAPPLADWRLNRVLEGYDLLTAEGRRAALNKAMPVVAEAESTLERERLITRLAQYHRAKSKGEVLEESQIRREVERLRTRRKQEAQPYRVEEPGRKVVQQQLSATDKAERALLGIVIKRVELPERVFARLSPEQFISSSAQELATAVQELMVSVGNINIEELSDKVAGSQSEQLLNEILVGGAHWEPEGTPVDDLINVITTYTKEKRYKLLAEKLQREELNRNDEEYVEFCALVRELHK